MAKDEREIIISDKQFQTKNTINILEEEFSVVRDVWVITVIIKTK